MNLISIAGILFLVSGIDIFYAPWCTRFFERLSVMPLVTKIYIGSLLVADLFLIILGIQILRKSSSKEMSISILIITAIKWISFFSTVRISAIYPKERFENRLRT